jgi:inorganic pyrophosphatase
LVFCLSFLQKKVEQKKQGSAASGHRTFASQKFLRMDEERLRQFLKMTGLRFQAHPWHGIEIGPQAPQVVTAFIEITPTDTVKYEIDKASGHLKVDRPQKFSNIVPALYGFVPQTHCKEEVGRFCMERTGRTGIVGDGDPLDICVLTEREIAHGNILVQAIPIGGLRLVDNNEADDKIIAVLKNDDLYGHLTDVAHLPKAILDRLRHYFLTYKQLPDERRQVEITHVYGREEAWQVISASQRDYRSHFS